MPATDDDTPPLMGANESLFIHGRRMPPGHLPRYFEHLGQRTYNSSDPVQVAHATSLVPMLWTMLEVFILLMGMILFCRWIDRRRARLGMQEWGSIEIGAKTPLREKKDRSRGLLEGGSFAVADLNMSEVRDHLDACRLTRYLRAFEANGYDDWGEILAMSDKKLQLLVERTAMSSNHGDRFLEFVERIKRPVTE